jgi:hypothetical protein
VVGDILTSAFTYFSLDVIVTLLWSCNGCSRVTLEPYCLVDNGPVITLIAALV